MYIYIMYMHLYYMILYLYIIFMCMYSISTYRLKYDLSEKLCRCAWHRWSLGPIEKSTKTNKQKKMENQVEPRWWETCIGRHFSWQQWKVIEDFNRESCRLMNAFQKIFRKKHNVFMLWMIMYMFGATMSCLLSIIT